ncbi:hypothetical protein GEMRC1_010690 [Eukaryota sp. GEM-RC1]
MFNGNDCLIEDEMITSDFHSFSFRVNSKTNVSTNDDATCHAYANATYICLSSSWSYQQLHGQPQQAHKKKETSCCCSCCACLCALFLLIFVAIGAFIAFKAVQCGSLSFDDYVQHQFPATDVESLLIRADYAFVKFSYKPVQNITLKYPITLQKKLSLDITASPSAMIFSCLRTEIEVEVPIGMHFKTLDLAVNILVSPLSSSSPYGVELGDLGSVQIDTFKLASYLGLARITSLSCVSASIPSSVEIYQVDLIPNAKGDFESLLIETCFGNQIVHNISNGHYTFASTFGHVTVSAQPSFNGTAELFSRYNIHIEGDRFEETESDMFSLTGDIGGGDSTVSIYSETGSVSIST